MFLGTLEDEQKYFTDILFAIKQVMSSHLHDIQEKFQQRFERLEEEVRNKDEIINQLKAHICELEKVSNEDSFTVNRKRIPPSVTKLIPIAFQDSIETVVSRDRHSWDDPSHEEVEELQDLPQPMRAWPPASHNVILDIDSTTDTESDIADSSEPEESGEYENSSSNWEIELLAAQIRERRSASLDHNVGRPLRKRFVKGASMDCSND